MDWKILFTVVYSKLSERKVYTEKLKQTETILIQLIKIQVAPQTLRSRARPTLLVPTAIAVWNCKKGSIWKKGVRAQKEIQPLNSHQPPVRRMWRDWSGYTPQGSGWAWNCRLGMRLRGDSSPCVNSLSGWYMGLGLCCRWCPRSRGLLWFLRDESGTCFERAKRGNHSASRSFLPPNGKNDRLRFWQGGTLCNGWTIVGICMHGFIDE